MAENVPLERDKCGGAFLKCETIPSTSVGRFVSSSVFDKNRFRKCGVGARREARSVRVFFVSQSIASIMKMCSRIRVSSCQLWIICVTIMITCEANVPSRKSWAAAHRVLPVWGTTDDAMNLLVNDAPFQTRHRRKFSKLNRLMEKRLGIRLPNYEVGEEAGGHVDWNRVTNDEKPYLKQENRDALRFNDELTKPKYKVSGKESRS